MAILNSLSVNGNAGVTGSVNLGVSGEIKEGDYRAIDGDTLSKATFYPPYKEVLFGPNNYQGITCPIPVDSSVKSTRAIVVRIIPYNSWMFVPRFFQLYDPDNWLLSGNINSSNPLKIYVVQLVNTRDAYVSNGTINLNQVVPGLYCGDNGSGYSFSVMVVTDPNLINTQGTATWNCGFSNQQEVVIMTAFTITNGSNVMTINNYDTIDKIRTAGLLKYL